MKIVKNVLFSVGVLLCGCGSGQQGEPEVVATDAADKNQVIETIMARRSVRKYKEQAVEREKLEQIVQCGIHAPNAMNRQSWEVRVVDNADYINGVTEVYRMAEPAATENTDFKNMFRNAPAVVFIASPKDGSGQVDCGLLGENIILAAQSLGLGTCCLGGPVRFMKSSADAAPYLEKLGFSEDYELLYAIGVGYPDEEPEAKPRDAEKIKFVD